MPKRPDINWEEVYEIYDGTMAHCLGGNCSKSCCGEKLVSDWGKPRVTYVTSFANREEYLFQQSLNPSFEDLRIDVIRADTTQDRGIQISYLVNRCLDTDGSCKLEGRKPLVCRLFPFNLNSMPPISLNCPNAREIILDREVVEKILEVRRRLVYPNEELWRENVSTCLVAL